MAARTATTRTYVWVAARVDPDGMLLIEVWMFPTVAVRLETALWMLPTVVLSVVIAPESAEIEEEIFERLPKISWFWCSMVSSAAVSLNETVAGAV